jgi:hypothetical protein
MHFRQILLLGIIIIYLPVIGQVSSNNDAYTFSISGSEVALTNLYSVNNNQAGLAFYKKTAIAINYNNRYLIPELSDQSLVTALPIGKSTVGASIFHFGGRLLNESKFSVAYGRQLFKWLAAGIQMNYHTLEVESVNQNGSAISGNLGLQAIPKKGVIIGMQIENPTNSKFTHSQSSDLYTGMKTGISYSVPNSFLITSQLNWNEFEKVTILFGGEYLLIKNLSLRFGMKLPENPTFSFGTGIICHRIAIDFGFEQHPVLGLSAAVSIIIELKNHDY